MKFINKAKVIHPTFCISLIFHYNLFSSLSEPNSCENPKPNTVDW